MEYAGNGGQEGCTTVGHYPAVLGTSSGGHSWSHGAVPAGILQTGRRQCEDAAELGTGEAAAVGAGCGASQGPSGRSGGGVDGGPIGWNGACSLAGVIAVVNSRGRCGLVQQ